MAAAYTKAQFAFVLKNPSSLCVAIARENVVTAGLSEHLSRATVGRESAKYGRDSAAYMANARRLGHAIMQRQ